MMEAEVSNSGDSRIFQQDSKSELLHESGKDGVKAEKFRRTRFVRFPNIFFDMISLDNVKGFGGKKRGLRDKSSKAANSLSMENLIF